MLSSFFFPSSEAATRGGAVARCPRLRFPGPARKAALPGRLCWSRARNPIGPGAGRDRDRDRQLKSCAGLGPGLHACPLHRQHRSGRSQWKSPSAQLEPDAKKWGWLLPARSTTWNKSGPRAYSGPSRNRAAFAHACGRRVPEVSAGRGPRPRRQRKPVCPTSTPRAGGDLVQACQRRAAWPGRCGLDCYLFTVGRLSKHACTPPLPPTTPSNPRNDPRLSPTTTAPARRLPRAPRPQA